MKHVALVLCALSLLFVAGCNLNGLKGGVSLEVGSARYLSGSTIDAGTVSYPAAGIGFDATKVIEVSLVNETDLPLTITPSGAANVVPTYGQYVDTISSGKLASWESGELGWIVLSKDISSATIPVGGTADFEITLDANLAIVPDSNRRWETRQDYKIALDDGKTSYDFVFEVYGVVAC